MAVSPVYPIESKVLSFLADHLPSDYTVSSEKLADVDDRQVTVRLLSINTLEGHEPGIFRPILQIDVYGDTISSTESETEEVASVMNVLSYDTGIAYCEMISLLNSSTQLKEPHYRMTFQIVTNDWR